MSKLKYYDGTNWNIVNGQVIGDTLPIGSIVPYVSSTVPTGWLVCDGSAVSRTTYADLFAVIGTSYGTGDGSATFNLPNLKGRVPVGQNTSDTSFDTIGETGGEKLHTLTTQEIPAHSHTMYDRGRLLYWDASLNNVGIKQGTGADRPIESTWNDSTANAGGGQAHNNLQPYQVVCYIIKASQSSGVVGNVSNVPSQSTTDTYSCDYINELINMLYPIGTIIIKADNNDYSNYLGFTWERTLVGRVAVGINSNDTDFDTIGETGGNKTHTQTTDEVAAHTHQLWVESDQSGSAYGLPQSEMFWEKAKNNWANGQFGVNRTNVNNPTPMNIMNPYQVVAYWKRVS